MTTDTDTPTAAPGFIGADELRGWCVTPEGRQTTRELLTTLRSKRAEYLGKTEPNLAHMRRVVAKEEANMADVLAKFDRQIAALETALGAVGELQA